MHPTLHGFADFVGRCLAQMWVREQENNHGDVGPPETHSNEASPQPKGQVGRRRTGQGPPTDPAPAE